jgi:hypothetical protein
VSGPQWFLLACFVVFGLAARHRISQAFPRPGSDTLAAGRGDVPPAVLYSLTAAMMPWRKETASRHRVSYLLGMCYHAGIFLSALWLVAFFFGIRAPETAGLVSMFLLALATLSGLALLIKRTAVAAMRYLSNPDDYFSNSIATGFVALTCAAIRHPGIRPTLFVYAGALLLYLPVGKLRHAVYFALARIYLGLFYGRRGVWPAGGGKSWQA